MKKWMRALLALMTALNLLFCAALTEPTRAEEAGATAVPLPAVGDVINGFEVTELRDFPLMQAQLVLFEHQNTGAKLLYIANEDTNRAFQLTFLTRPSDNTGLPHVFEHATTSGSEKYPSTALFFNLINQTYNTDMSAYTTDAMTSYPVASLSEAQLLKYADYYTDSCLHPMVMTDESIYRREAWRYTLENPDAELNIEGTVYSEMRGTQTLVNHAITLANQLTFPGSVLGYTYGGDPDYIPDMTWESLRNYHDLYYHPSNCMAFLYGKLADYTKFLALLDGAFAGYERSDFHFEDSGYTRITEAAEQKLGFPMEAGTAVDNQSTVIYYIVCPGLRENKAQEFVMDNLLSVLSMDPSPLMQRLKQVLPTGLFSLGREVAAVDDAIIFMANQVNEDDAPLFRETVDTVLREIAENGLSQDMVDSVAAQISLSNKLTTENGSTVDSILYSFAYNYAVTGDIFSYLDMLDSTEQLSEMNANGQFTEAIKAWLLGNPLTTLTTLYPEPGAREEKDAALRAKLMVIKEGMSETEVQAIVDATHAEQPEEDTSEMVAQLQAVTVESLPEEVREYPVSDVTGEDGIRRIDVTANVDGIGKPTVYLDAQALPQEDLLWLRLYQSLLGQLDTDAHTVEELGTLLGRYMSGRSIELWAIGDDAETLHPYFKVSWIAEDADLATGYALLDELLFHTQFTDTGTLLNRIQATSATTRASVNANAGADLLYRGFGVENVRARFFGYIDYSSYYTFLEQVEAAMAEHPEEVVARLKAIQTFLHNSDGAVAGFAGNAESITVNRPLADAFLASLENVARERVTLDLPVAAKREALITTGNVQLNYLFASFADMGLEGYDAGMNAISLLVEDVFLVPLLRNNYGVYTPTATMHPRYGLYLEAYYDPNIRETYDVYASLGDRLAALDLDQATLDGYILSAYSSLAKPVGELTGAANVVVETLEGLDPARKLTYMRQLKTVTPETVKASAELFRNAWKNGAIGTAGGFAAVSENADLFDMIRNPFNAQDTSSVVFEDVPEDSESYAAVRFVFENGLMAPLGDTVFGVDEAATVGDFLSAICTAIGNPVADGAAARDLMAQYGLVTADQDPAEALTEQFVVHLLVTGFGAQISTDTPDTVVTRGDLAGLLIQLFQGQ